MMALAALKGVDGIPEVIAFERGVLTRRYIAGDAMQCVLATPSILSRTWMVAGKPVYLFITRRLLGWSDREGAGDRRK